ncbi:hypothetical protein ILUMI_02519 [Ignelater luminosus]|uniref:PiggyBac transposable element-derived protein domain-containing protein n=1 Tax=Ignelater luminosus TaxID=2038154 RepID=A0A8K0DI49_IGNLU|nr:hypothetical protein ILUMI_02519 [Ignelater luminosus]
MDLDHWSNVVVAKDVAEVVQLLEDNIGENKDAEVQDIIITPPAANEPTDEGNGDEDTGGFLNNLPCSQLVTEAEAVLSNSVCIGGNTYDFSGYSTRRDRKWTDGDLVWEQGVVPKYPRWVFGKATDPMISFLDELPDDKKSYPYHIVRDNLFTSLNLLRHLREREYSGTGTIRKNRILPSHEQMKKMERGTFRWNFHWKMDRQ